MPELFEDVSVDEFALPTDADQIARKNAKAMADTGETAPAAAVEPEQVVEEPAEPVAEEPAAGEEVVAEETASEKLLAGNFKTTEELERAYEELRSLNGRQSQELGELRKTFEEQFAQINQRLETPTAPPVQITADLIESNPAYAAQLAYEQNNGVAFQAAFEQWKEEQPFEAAAWAATKHNEEQLAALRAEQEQRYRELQAQVAPAAENVAASQVTSLIAQAEATTPGLSEFVASDKVAPLAQEFPEVAAALLSGTPKQKFESLRALHLIAKGRESDNLKATTEQVGRATAEEAQRVREEAFVASATTTSSGVKPSKADTIAAEWDAMDAPHRDGWNI